MSILLVLTAFSVIASALVSGVFLTFSDFVMRALDRTRREGGVEAMQIINREVFPTLFMALLMGMSVLSFVLVYLMWPQAGGAGEAPDRLLVLSGSVIYLVLVFAVTLIGNVPLNMKLDRISHTSADTATFWSATFYPRWTMFNHIRTFGAGAASVCFLLACLSPVAA